MEAIYTNLQKKYSILPMTNDLDRMNDRFSWSAPSNECVITATEKNHTIGDRLLQELWSCYSICFNEICNKKVPYNAGVKCSNLIDVTNSAVPFLSNTVDKKRDLSFCKSFFQKTAIQQKQHLEFSSQELLYSVTMKKSSHMIMV